MEGGVGQKMTCDDMIADIYISISTETFDIENIKYEKKLTTVRFRYIL